MSVVLLGSTSGSVTLQEPAVAGSTVIDLPATSGTMAVLPTATSVLPEASGGTGTTTGYYGFKSRIINGGMVIDQRNAAAAVTVNAASRIYSLDRWFGYGEAADGVFTIQQDTNAPTGFKNSLKVTTTTADASVGASQFYLLGQSIEGFNFSDFDWGTANAKTITLSFWVRSSLTGQFGGSLTNSGNSRSYPYSYTINVANTWEQKSVTIAGDTTGTWLGATNGIGVNVWFDLGCGSSNIGTAGAWAGVGNYGATGDTKLISTLSANLYITGVQLEKGSTATSFDYRPYGTELALCQRYYIKISNPTGSNAGYGAIVGGYTTVRSLGSPHCLPVSMRVSGGNVVIAFSSVSLYRIDLSVAYPVTSISAWAGDFSVPSIDIGVASGLTAGTSYIFTILTNGFVSYSAEL